MCKILTNERKTETRHNNSPLREINPGVLLPSGSKTLKSAVENPNIQKKKKKSQHLWDPGNHVCKSLLEKP